MKKATCKTALKFCFLLCCCSSQNLCNCLEILQIHSRFPYAESSFDFEKACFKHTDCPPGRFCSISGLLDDYYGKWLSYGECFPCEKCSCDNVAIDGVCPLSRCPEGQKAIINRLTGTFYNLQGMTDGSYCFTAFIFEGQTFRQISFILTTDLLHSALPKLDADEDTVTIETSQCSDIHAGLKAGTFTVDARNIALLTYTDGYNYFRNRSLAFTARISFACPNLRVLLDRSPVPTFILYDPLHPAPALGYNAVTDPLLNPCGAREVGLCLSPHLIPARVPLSLVLRPAGPGPDQAFSGQLSRNAWRSTALAQPAYFPGGSACTLILEHAAAGLLRYFRMQTYGCAMIENKPSGNATVTANRTSVGATTRAAAPTTTNPPLPPPATTSRLVTTTPLTVTTFSPSFTSSTRALGPCRGYADLNASATSSGGGASGGEEPAVVTVLDCEEGAISLLQYPPHTNRSWRVGRAGRNVAIRFVAALGLRPVTDHVRLWPPPPAPPVYISGAETDPAPAVRVRVCLADPACDDWRSEDLGRLGLSLAGPVLVTMWSGPGAGAGGAILEYAIEALPPARRRGGVGGGVGGGVAHARAKEALQDLATVPAAGVEEVYGAAITREIADPAAAFPADGCTCVVGPSASAPAAAACSSPFFFDTMCAAAVAAWPWLAFHAAAALVAGPGSAVTVDAVVYLERFSNLGSRDRLYVTAAFKLFTPGLAHPRDVIALFKGGDGDTGACDARRTLAACARSNPLASPPTLDRQLCWAYTSAVAGPAGLWDDPHVPGPTAATAGSVNFCSDVAESAGNGTYYAVLYSYNLKRVVAQVDYIQERDCQCRNSTTGGAGVCEGAAPFPCLPLLLPNQKRRYDYSGPLALCQIMTYRGGDGICRTCPDGKYTDVQNAPACSSCPAGTYLPLVSSGLPACVQCPKLLTADSVVNAACGLVFDVSAAAAAMRSTPTTAWTGTDLRMGVTSTAAFCGDGRVKQTPIGAEQCDSGQLSKQWNLSSAVSFFDTKLPSIFLDQFAVFFRVCDGNCQIQREQCGDRVVFKGPTPIYALADCMALDKPGSPAPVYVCSKQFRKENSSVVYMEECDDGNQLSGDGCSSTCRIERLWDCVPTENGDVCTYLCQDGKLNTSTGEECDDGNSQDGDGCSHDCKIDCGFQCRLYDPESQSVCGSICGDGLVSSNEACDVKLVQSSPQNPYGRGCSSSCQIEGGWECNQVEACFSTNQSKQVQICNPVCGDGVVLFPEECDDGEWNLVDKACTPSCIFNRGHVCYGTNCSMANPRPQSVDDALFGSLLKAADGVAEGIWFLVKNEGHNAEQSRMFPVLSSFSSRVSALPNIFPTYINEKFLFQDAVLSSLALTCPVCPKAAQTVLKAVSGVIEEDWRLLANDVSCTFKFRPDEKNSVIRLIISDLYMNVDAECTACLYLELTTSLYNAPGRSVRRFNRSSAVSDPFYLYAPADITIFGKHSAFASDHNVSMLRLFMTFTSSSLSQNQLSCISKCSWNSSCTKVCFGSDINKLSKNQHFQLEDPSLHNVRYISKHISRNQNKNLSNEIPMEKLGFIRRDYFEEILGQILVIRNQPIFTSALTPQPIITYPCSFSQRPDPSGSLLIPVERIASVTDSSFQGSWQGSCSAFYSSSLPSVSCSVRVYFMTDTILKHITDCPLRGYSVGRVISMDSDITTATDAGFESVSYKRAIISWTGSTTIVDSVNRTYLSIFSFAQKSDESDFKLQILLEGAIRTDLLRPKFLTGGRLADESNCRLLDLQPMQDATFLTPQFQNLPRSPDEDRFIRCNMSLALAVSKLQNSSFDCLVLLKAFVFRDFWVPLNIDVSVINSTFDYESLHSFTCNSKCLSFFQLELSKSLDVCHTFWDSQWSNFQIGIRLFKVLMSISSALFWTTIICTSNHHNESCASLVSTLPSWFPGYREGCPKLLKQSIFGPLFGQNQSYSGTCLLELQSYVNALGCCVQTVDEAGMLWLKHLSNKDIGLVSVYLGDRSNPFNTSFPFISSETDLVEIAFNNTMGSMILSNGKSPSKIDFQGFTTVHDALTTYGKGCQWPENNQKCCNLMKCARGFKPFTGSCSCICPAGYGGPLCDAQGFYVETVLRFPGKTLFKTFSFCDFARLTQFFRKRVGLQSISLEIVPLVSKVVSNGGQRRESQDIDVSLMVRLSLLACDSTARMTQILASLFSVDTNNLFNTSGLPSPKIVAISSYCSGVKTSCGWAGSSENDMPVDSVAVSAACAEKGGNSTFTPTINTLETHPQSQWQPAVFAVVGCLGFAAILGAFIFFRNKKPTCLKCLKFSLNLPKESKILKWFLLSKTKVTSQTIPLEISFDKSQAMKTPNAILISNPYQAVADFEIVYRNEYEAPGNSIPCSEYECSIFGHTDESVYQLSKSGDSEHPSLPAPTRSPSQQISSRTGYSNEFDIHSQSGPTSSRSLQISSRILFSDDFYNLTQPTRTSSPSRQISSRVVYSDDFQNLSLPTLTNSQPCGQISSQFSYSNDSASMFENSSQKTHTSLLLHQKNLRTAFRNDRNDLDSHSQPTAASPQMPQSGLIMQNCDQLSFFPASTSAEDSPLDDIEIRRVPRWSAFEPP